MSVGAGVGLGVCVERPWIITRKILLLVRSQSK